MSKTALLCAIEFLKSFITKIILSTNFLLESKAILSPISFDIDFLIFKLNEEIKFPNSPNVIISKIAHIGTLSINILIIFENSSI